jgi:hypothetical protein
VLIFRAGGSQRNVETPKTSRHAHFQGWLMPEKGQNPEDEHDCSSSGLVVARERSKPRKRAVVLVFGAGGGQRKVEAPKTSMTARFRGGMDPEKVVVEWKWLLVMYNGSQPLRLAFRAREGCWLSRWRWLTVSVVVLNK